MLPPTRLEDHTCECGDGYVNDEGTLVQGSLIKEGFALGKDDYEDHKRCRQCAVNPWGCDDRRALLAPQVDGQGATTPDIRRFEFFVPRKGISQTILEAFLVANSKIDPNFYPDRYFRARSRPLIRIECD